MGDDRSGGRLDGLDGYRLGHQRCIHHGFLDGQAVGHGQLLLEGLLLNQLHTLFYGLSRLPEEKHGGQGSRDGRHGSPHKRIYLLPGCLLTLRTKLLELGKTTLRKRTLVPFQALLDYVFPLFHTLVSFLYRLILSFNCFRALASIPADPFSLIPNIPAISLCE